MRRPRSDSRPRGLRAIGALLALGLVLAPFTGALAHDAHALHGTALIHSEASHPRATPHYEREEHIGADDCFVCLHTGHSYLRPPLVSWRAHATVVDATCPPAPAFAARSHASATPRAPPV